LSKGEVHGVTLSEEIAMSDEESTKMRGLAGMALAGPVALAAALAGAGTDEAYRAEVLKWRETREANLKKEGGWLSVTGLFWLKEGQNSFGSAPDNDIVLPEGPSPARAGTFDLRGQEVKVALLPGVAATVDGETAGERELLPDTTGTPDVLALCRLRMHVLRRGERFAIRLKDPESAARRNFTGLAWFDVQEAARVRALFVPYDEPKMIRVPNIVGQSSDMPSPGYCVFPWEGKEVRLEGVFEEADAKELFFIFRDSTSGKETYPAGRFLYSALPQEGEVTLDFNKAYNPPCAFTAFATCPLPPPQNWMPVAMAAGEKTYGH
jgi:uncharacterized protein (DUF1684 family)